MAANRNPKDTNNEQKHRKAEAGRKAKESERKIEHKPRETEADHRHKGGLDRPGNEDYLSYYKLQEKWKPTQAIGSIGAMRSGPGPAGVNLPPAIGDKNHDPRKIKAPAFSIGLKDNKMSFSENPGPGAYNIRKQTNKGLDVCHAPVIGETIKGITVIETPGPAAYDRSGGDRCVKPKILAYSIRPKIKPAKRFIPPAPSSYTLPETLGPGLSPFKRSPCYSMGEKSYKTGVFRENPGPAAYKLPSSNVNKPKAPSFSMRTREEHPLLSKTGITSPGPASNYYHMVKYHKPATPRYTFGVRHTPFKAFQKFAAEE